MLFAIATVFVVGYLAIALEHTLGINKTATAMLTGVLCWTVYALSTGDPARVGGELSHHLASTAEILFFLLGAMTVVELIDAHDGFRVLTERITARNTRTLLWINALLAFFLSAVLDNLTASIVMVALTRKLVHDEDTRRLFAGLTIIAANAGGVWSPIGDVTTTMLWIGGQITAGNIIPTLFVPSLVALLVPLTYLSWRTRGTLPPLPVPDTRPSLHELYAGRLMLTLGVSGLLFVPVFKTITHLPPYMGMLLVLGILWLASELLHSHKDEEERKPYTAVHALSRIDTPSILFFLGILLSVAALESTHQLTALAAVLNRTVGNLDAVVTLIGVASALVDNVPLVAASMGMYDLATYPTDHKLWEFLAYCAGTGGSLLIIGSAAGVAVMGLEKISFGWYLRHVSFLALMGYLSGALTYLIGFAWLR